ncbi:MAG TPA: GNAT family N-acetyltransferase [Albitalea sp.]|nr:GNAT family N-acetyltransferase [Albitalea sp.]
MNELVIRPLDASDSIEALTHLLHRAYAALAVMGLNYTAIDQLPDVTARRVADGQCFVAALGVRIAGTVTVSGPYERAKTAWAHATEWFFRADTAHFHQLGVEPELQGQRIGQRLVAHCEEWARSQGFRHMALDTAVPAHHLRARYARLGYRDVDEVQWKGKVYRSVIMAKEL